MSGETPVLSWDELKEILEKEFHVQESEWNLENKNRARNAIEWYENADDFFNRTGWKKSNPECSTEGYLIRHRICRWVNGKFMYFSWLRWDTGELR